MKVPFGTMTISSGAKKLVKKVLDSGRLSGGKYVREFEERFAHICGSKEAVAVSSGTDADALALAVLYDFGAKRGDEIVIPALSFAATGNAVLQAGFRPVFVDVEKDTLNIDPSLIEKAITKRTRAIMPVHLMGKPAKMSQIINIAKKNKLYVVEDAAEAHGSVYKGKNIGTIGHLGAFSLYVAHIISTVEGGVVVTDRPDFAEILRSLRAHGRACKCRQCVVNTSSKYCSKRFQYGKGRDIRFIFERIGFSAKMNELEAAVGLGNLDKYEEILNKRRENFHYLHKKFQKFCDKFYTINEDNNEIIGPHAFPIILKKNVNFSRDSFVNFLDKKGIDTRDLFSSMPTQCDGFGFLGYKKGDFPNAEYIGLNGLHLGIHQDLTNRHLDYVIRCIEDFLVKK